MQRSRDIIMVIDLNKYDKKSLYDSMAGLLNSFNFTNYNIDIFPFVDTYDTDLETKVKLLSNCKSIKTLNTVSYLDKIKSKTRDDISLFVSKLREQILSLAKKKIGGKWSKKFSELWWYSFLSEKNSPAGCFWWNIFYLETIRYILNEHGYKKCLFIGPKNLAYTIQQLCKKSNVGFQYKVLESARSSKFNLKPSILKFIIFRNLALLSSILILTLSRSTYGCKQHNRLTKNSSAKKILIYSYYPRVWTTRFGKWQDMYWGETFNKLCSYDGLEPIHVLFHIDRDNISYFKYFIDRMRKLRVKNMQPRNFVLLESYVNPWYALKEYLNIKDIFQYWLCTRTDGFKELFIFKDIELYKTLSLEMWRSVIIWWPSMLVLRKCATNVAKELNPILIALPFFEYIDGRAIVQGSRLGTSGKIIGLQHGPITSMKTIYSGVPDELKQNNDGNTPLPAPDLYSVDGRLAKEILMQRGISKENIKTIGPARFDDVWKLGKLSSRKMRFQGKKVTVLIAPGLHDTELMLLFVLNALKGVSGIRIIIKLHPKVSSSSIKQMLGPFSNITNKTQTEVVISQEHDIYKNMENAEILVTTYSTVGVEAIAFGLTVILLVLKRVPDMSPMSYDGSPILSASTPETLRKYISLIMMDSVFRENYRRKLEKIVSYNFGVLDSNASTRLAELCARQVKIKV